MKRARSGADAGADAAPPASGSTKESPDGPYTVTRAKRGKNGELLLHTGLTGARTGDVLVSSGVGCGDSEGVLLELVSGTTEALPCYCTGVSDDELLKVYQRRFGLSGALAKQRLADRPLAGESIENSLPLGCGCPSLAAPHDIHGDCDCPQARFVVLQPGSAWVSHFDTAGNLAVLNAWVAEGTPITWRDVLRHVGVKKLVMRRVLYAVGQGPRVAVDVPAGCTPVDGRRVVTAPGADEDKTPSVLYELKAAEADDASFYVRACESQPALQSDYATVKTIVEAALRRLQVEAASEADVAACHRCLSQVTQGGLKSAVQKTVRFGRRRVALGHLKDNASVRADVYAAVACALLALGKGGFVPELQIFTRGVTSALKRTAVILLEDAYPAPLDCLRFGAAEAAASTDLPREIERLLALALLTQQLASYTPPLHVYVDCVALVAAAARSDCVLDWRPHEAACAEPARAAKAQKKSSADDYAPLAARAPVATARSAGEAAAALRGAHRLLCTLGSFSGDKLMVRIAARLAAGDDGALPVRVAWTPAVLAVAKPQLRSAAAVAAAERQARRQAAHWPREMSDCHVWDQHVQRGIGHVVNFEESGPAVGATFKSRFQSIFNRVTGVNPRWSDMPDGDAPARFEDDGVVREVRFAQRLVAMLATPSLYASSGGSDDGSSDGARSDAPAEKVTYRVHPGTLAAGVGPVKVTVDRAEAAFRREAEGSASEGSDDEGSQPPAAKRRKVAGKKKTEMLVLLGTERSEEEVAMLPPSRDVNDLYNAGKKPAAEEAQRAAEQAEAVRLCRLRAHAVRSPLLPPGKKATFADGRWHFDGTPWEEVVDAGLTAQVRTAGHPDPGEEWELFLMPGNPAGHSILHDNDIIEHCVSYALRLRDPAGIVPSAQSYVERLCRIVDRAVVDRAVSLLRQQFVRVELPTPSLAGGRGTDQLQAYPRDWDVYRFVMLLTRLVPGALVPTTPPRFRVVNPVLLTIALSFVTQALTHAGAPPQAAPSAPTAGGNGWAAAAWVAADKRRGGFLKEHQHEAVDRMWDRSQRPGGGKGHFLVMETGLGKTATALCYLTHRLVNTPLGQEVDKIVWLTPAGTKKGTSFTLIDSLLKELDSEDKVQVPCNWVVPTSSGGRSGAVFKPHSVNVLAHHHLIKVLDTLVRDAARCVFVFDEVDEFYNQTQRTSAALLLAGLAGEFVAQTATPMTRTTECLARWLALTEEYPVDASNYLVAASSMVSLRIALNIQRTATLRTVPLHDAARKAFTRYTETKNWAVLARAVQDLTDAALCDEAVATAAADRKTHPAGGVLLVADNSDHAARLQATMRALGTRTGGPEDLRDASCACVVVTKVNSRGYNQAIRLGAVVRGVYAGNGAARHQMEGRICRIGQARSEVFYKTVVMENTILALLHERQQRVDTVNISLEQLAREYDETVFSAADTKRSS